jgi:mitochondrial enoyl-[acyl-carrier protein] reductase / trans-2-enoyl-CoA reductase
MKSTHLVFRSFGAPQNVLELNEFSPPPLETNDVFLKILASPINPADLNLIEGTYGIKPPLPATPGIECSAKVIQSNSPKFSLGDLVMPISRIGAWATHAVTPESNLIKLPTNTDPLQAAMLRINPATAWLLLTYFEQLAPDDLVVLNAANSNVAQCLIQIAYTMGIRTACFLRNEAHSNFLTNLGATHVFPDTPNGIDEARTILGKQPAKLAFNAVGGESALRLLKLLGNNATHITYGAMARKPLTIPNSPLIFHDIRFRGLWVTKWIENTPVTDLQTLYSKLANLSISGKLTQSTDSTFPLTAFTEALHQNKSPQRNGKILFSNLADKPNE